MRTIWKFELPIDDEPILEMPIGAEVLYVGSQVFATNFEPLCLWATVDSGEAPIHSMKTEPRRFLIVGTGNSMPEEAQSYIGSVQMKTLPLVWHIFEKG